MFPGKFTRYILWDVLKLFALTLVAMTLVISLTLVGQKLVAEGLTYLALAKLLPFIFLIALQYSVPPTLLFAVCCVYGRISADNEIIALKSAGISPMHVFRPVVVLGVLLSIPSVWIQDKAVSWGKPGMEAIILRSVEEIIYQRLRANQSYDNEKGLSIYVKSVEDRWLIKPNITVLNDERCTTINAEKAKISMLADQDSLVIDLYDSYASIDGAKQVIWPGLQSIEIPLNLAAKSGTSDASPSQYSISQIPKEITRQRTINQRRKEKLASRFSMGLATGRFGELSDPTSGQLNYEMHETEKRLAKLQTEPMRRWAQGFSCLAFVWFGVPLAIRIRSADYWWTFGVCFIPTLLIYYPLFGLALDFAKGGKWPAVSLWLGNITLTLIGTWMMREVIRN
jgi:lipopolysaccharide export system permease protein